MGHHADSDLEVLAGRNHSLRFIFLRVSVCCSVWFYAVILPVSDPVIQCLVVEDGRQQACHDSGFDGFAGQVVIIDLLAG